jgi:hypothetical protein
MVRVKRASATCLLLLVVVPALSYADFLVDDLVDQPMLIGDPP